MTKLRAESFAISLDGYGARSESKPGELDGLMMKIRLAQAVADSQMTTARLPAISTR
jgi:hypothetical protein